MMPVSDHSPTKMPLLCNNSTRAQEKATARLFSDKIGHSKCVYLRESCKMGLPVSVPEMSTFNQILEVCGLGIVGFAASRLRKRNRFRKV
jgi:hypothetical protein